MSIKRLKSLFIIILSVFVILAIRLFFIQIIGLERVETTALNQYGSELKGINYRGNIVDRNGISFVNRNDVYMILMDKSKYSDRASECLKLLDAEMISINNRRYYGFITDKYIPSIINEIEKEYGGYVFLSNIRYSFPQTAAHLIGYCNKSENVGTYGLERAFDGILMSDGSLKLTVDGAGRILKGCGVSYSESKSAEDLKTTLDYDIQSAVEDILCEKDCKGAAVVIADVETGGILCSASYPVFDPDHVDKAEGSGLVNRALQYSYPPGSVFKIIVAAAAIENGVAMPEDEFFCSGSEDLYGVKIKCGKEEGHGQISFQEAFEKSCNCVFIQLGQLVGRDKLLDMSKRFGIGEKVLDCLKEETSGNLANSSQVTGAGIGNLSIGQGETEITCLQAARIAGIIACGGKDPGLYLVEGQGNDSKDKQVISLRTALVLKKLMSGVVSEGTGKKAGEDAAGKSGSAQAYVNKKKVVHGWFAGFFPVQNPKYIVAVFTENSDGSGAASQIFGEIHDKLR